MMRLIPHLDVVQTEDFGSRLPWNRAKCRRLMRAKHVVVHLFSGPDQNFWDKQCSSSTTEVLCIDTTLSTAANLHDRSVYGFLLMLCASARVRAILGGPPCRALTALRYQGDNGPGVLRDDEHPYGLPTLSPGDMELVRGDTILVFRFWSLFMLAEEVRDVNLPPTQFFMEKLQDPADYRHPQDAQEHKYFSIFRTEEWKSLAATYNLSVLNFDQFPMGHPKCKLTSLATNVPEMMQLDEIRGASSNEAELANEYRAMSMEQRCATFKIWSAGAPGLKMAIAAAICHNINMLDQEERAGHVSVRSPKKGPGQLNKQISVQSLEPQTQQPHEENDDAMKGAAPRSNSNQFQPPMKMKTLSAVARHFLNEHMPARRDCSHCVKAQARSKPHRKIQHAESYTLSVDLSGKMSAGVDQQLLHVSSSLMRCRGRKKHQKILMYFFWRRRTWKRT